MKTRLFTFILLASMMISYSSCGSDDPYSDNTEQVDKTQKERLAIEEKIAESINGNTYRCDELDSEFKVVSAGKNGEKSMIVITTFRFTGKVKFGDRGTAGGEILYDDYTISYDNAIGKSSGLQVYNQYFKYINKDNIEGVNSLAKGTWKRKQVDNGESNNNSNNNLKINVDSIAKIIGLNTFINTDTNDKLEIYAWTQYDSNLKNHCFKASYSISNKGLKGVNIKLMVRYTVGYYWLYSEKDGVALDPVWVYRDENTLTSDLPDLKGTWKKIRK